MSTTTKIALQAVLNHQTELRDAAQALEKVQSVIAEQAQRLNELRSARPASPDFAAMRGNVLAEEALGRLSAQQRKDQEAQLNKAEADHASRNASIDKQITDCEATLRGLEVRRTDLEKQLSELAEKSESLRDDLIVAAAEEIAEQYVKAASELIESLLRLNALGGLVVGKRRDFRWKRIELEIPAFRLAACEALKSELGGGSHFPSTLIDATTLTHSSRNFHESLQAEKRRLRQLGVEL